MNNNHYHQVCGNLNIAIFHWRLHFPSTHQEQNHFTTRLDFLRVCACVIVHLAENDYLSHLPVYKVSTDRFYFMLLFLRHLHCTETILIDFFFSSLLFLHSSTNFHTSSQFVSQPVVHSTQLDSARIRFIRFARSLPETIHATYGHDFTST